jgi:hypothetical protein
MLPWFPRQPLRGRAVRVLLINNVRIDALPILKNGSTKKDKNPKIA